MAITKASVWRSSARWLNRLGIRTGHDVRRNRVSTFDGDIVAAIERVGVHPFVLVRRRDEDDPSRRFVVCRTQNEAPQFVADLLAIPRFAESKLVRAVERALQLEIYEAADLLFSWTRMPAEGMTETAYFGGPATAALPILCGYPVFEIAAGVTPGSFDDRVGTLIDVFNAYAGAAGNDVLRHALIDAFALSVSRALGSSGQYEAAQQIVDRALAITPYAIHLKAAKHALILTLSGKEPPPRLQKFIGDDNGHMRQFVCSLPFERFDIGPDGNVMVCCGHWLPTSIGNFMQDPIDSVLNSTTAQKIRESVTDGSYRYCNHLECGTMVQETLPKRDNLSSERARTALAKNDFRVDGVEQILFAFDQTCNLSCPSCRTHLITEKASQAQDKARAIEEKLLPLLPTLRTLYINPAGELFASKPSRKLLELINDQLCPDLSLHIISNGVLFSEEEWNKFPGIHNRVQSIRISIDAACKETFEKLRRLGKYDVFLQNMRFLRQLRVGGVVSELKFSFTYQLENFREMRAFVEFCDEMHADYAIFERLQNIAFSHQEFLQKAVHYPDHPLHAAFIDVIKHPIFRTKRVWHDFDYDGVENMTREEALSRSDKAVPVPVPEHQ